MSRINVANFRHPDATADSITLTSGGDTQINRALGLNGANYGTSGQILTSQGSGSAPQWADLLSGGATVQVFTSSGTYTPTTGKTSYLVFAVGGGGGSGGTNGGSSGGGGSGGCGWRIYDNTELGANATVTVGNGGAGGTFLGAGGTGGTSSFNPAGTGLTVSGNGGSGSSGTSGSGSTAGGSAGGSTNSLTSWSGNPGFDGGDNRRGGDPAFLGRGRGANGSTVSTGNAGSAGVVVVLEF